MKDIRTTTKRRWLQCGILLLFLLMAMLGLGAYFTSVHTEKDVFTVGDIKVIIEGENDDYSVLRLLPYEEFTYKRHAKNVGINDAYVYLAVTMPYDEHINVDLDGTQVTGKTKTQYFCYGTNRSAGVDGNWLLIKNGELNNLPIKKVVSNYIDAKGEEYELMQNRSDEYGVVDAENKTVTYVYAYVNPETKKLMVLPAGEKTTDLFDTAKFCNIQQGQKLKEREIRVDLFAIQSDNTSDDVGLNWNTLEKHTGGGFRLFK